MAAVLRVKLVGCGGIAGHVAPNLCHYLHAERRPAHVVLIDGDAYEEGNRSRMTFSACDNKALIMARELSARFGDLLTIEPVPEYVTPANVDRLIEEGDVVLLAVDNHRTRAIVDARCAALTDVTLLSGGNDGVENGERGTFGNVQIVRRSGGRSFTNTLGHAHPEIRDPTDELPGGPGCAVLVAAGAPQLLFTNLAVASAMLNAFYGLLAGAVDYEEVYLDVMQNRVRPVVRPVE